MSQFGKARAALVLAGALLPGAGAAQGDPWAGPVRGSWVRTGTAAAGDVVLAWSIVFTVVGVLFAVLFLWHWLALPKTALDHAVESAGQPAVMMSLDLTGMTP